MGLGGCGAQVFVGLCGRTPEKGHPLVLRVQVAQPDLLLAEAHCDVDVLLTGDAAADAAALHRWIREVAVGERIPAVVTGGFVDFQLTRGLLGVTT